MYVYVSYMLFDHLVVCIIVMISAVVYLIVFNTYTFLMTRHSFFLSKFGMFTFFVSHTMYFILIFQKIGGRGAHQTFGFLVGNHRRRGKFSMWGQN